MKLFESVNSVGFSLLPVTALLLYVTVETSHHCCPRCIYFIYMQ